MTTDRGSDKMELISTKNGTKVVDFGTINLGLTLDCGQAFRWEKADNDLFCGVAYGKELLIKEEKDGLLFVNTPKEDIEKIWADYFDLTTDHDKIMKRLCGDKFIFEAYSRFGGIRILNQEPWETLCSFIISSCNNIPRIKSIIKRLSEAYGEKTGNSYSFPSAKVIATKNEEELAFLRAGYRVPYILDAARKVADGEISLENIRKMSENDARKELMKIKGVGKKVADCTLLFSLGFTDCYPVDRHIDRATKEFYPDGLPSFFTPNSGLAQQYIFSYMLFKNKNEE